MLNVRKCKVISQYFSRKKNEIKCKIGKTETLSREILSYCMYTYIYIYMCVCVCVCVIEHVYICIYINVYIQASFVKDGGTLFII